MASGLHSSKSASNHRVDQVMFSDSHGKEWSYSKTLLHPGDEVSNPIQLANGSVIVDMRGHDL